jgi:branched-chain amino acid transport system permease protein
MTARGERGWVIVILLALVALAFLPLAGARDDVLNFVFLILLSITLAQSWNIVAGYAGQVNLGHAAFFGLGALLARTLWIRGTPIVVALMAGAALAGYRLTHRYYLALALAGVSVLTVAGLAGSRAGLGMQAIREDEEAAEASGVGALRLKLTALVLSTALAGLAGGLFAYYHISYYPSHPFGPHWTFDALLMTFIGGVGTLHGPVLGAVLYVVLKEYVALRWVDFHLLIFGALFIAIVLLLPGGLVQAAARARGLLGRYNRDLEGGGR